MSPLLRSIVSTGFLVLLIFGVSCERHHIGEMPEAQRENLHPGAREAHPSAAEPPRASPTPAEFFAK
jgi:hypothetical protein